MTRPERLRGNGSAQDAATSDGSSSLITKAARFAPNRPAPRSRARNAGVSLQPHQRGRMPGHRSRGRAALPATPTPDPERRAAAAGRCTPRRSRGTLKDGRRRPEPCGVRRALRHGRQQGRCRRSRTIRADRYPGAPNTSGKLRVNLDSAVVLLKEMVFPLNKGTFALVELLPGPGAPSGLHARSNSISSIEQLPCKQVLVAQRASLPLSEPPPPPPEPQTFSHSFSHPRQPDARNQ